MKLKVLGSSSRGNCYILENDSEALILEAGVKFAEVQKALDFNIKKIVGCLITHEHTDHAGRILEFPRFVPLFASEGTMIKCVSSPNLRAIKANKPFMVGQFKIIPFAAQHDAAEPLGFFINHPETGNVLFATDTYYLPCTFAGLNNILIEANYRLDILERNIAAGKIPMAMRTRILQSHFSYEHCLEALQANDLRAVNNIVLIHLSDGNSHAQDFKEGIHKATGKRVHIAEPGLELLLNKTPF
ncbi:MAG: putative metallo-hydrolase YycJ [Candidatus Ordinivivax streblomastigis]|uniref:Putative metallo-hydrolase YycJ n=1 Tax=Candidatus Ordinivivax streblomastigis TaxID=2540710 RepID=A0A5M8P440_9BACT|nr:MAG: putative metallo-hydrolase YycJ [Candidatus Ordinivivax streblomastigis]